MFIIVIFFIKSDIQKGIMKLEELDGDKDLDQLSKVMK